MQKTIQFTVPITVQQSTAPRDGGSNKKSSQRRQRAGTAASEQAVTTRQPQFVQQSAAPSDDGSSKESLQRQQCGWNYDVRTGSGGGTGSSFPTQLQLDHNQITTGSRLDFDWIPTRLRLGSNWIPTRSRNKPTHSNDSFCRKTVSNRLIQDGKMPRKQNKIPQTEKNQQLFSFYCVDKYALYTIHTVYRYNSRINTYANQTAIYYQID